MGGQFLQECQLLGQQKVGGRWEFQPFQEAHALRTEEITALWQLQFMLAAQQSMNAIAQHRALANKKNSARAAPP